MSRRRWFAIAVTLLTLTANVLNSRGLDHETNGRLAAARADYHKALRLNPEYASAYNNRGNMRFRDGALEGAIADYAVDFLKEHARKHQNTPFYCYLAFTSPHFPLHALQDDITRHRDRYLAGWDSVRRQRWERLRNMGMVNCDLAPLEEIAEACSQHNAMLLVDEAHATGIFGPGGSGTSSRCWPSPCPKSA